MKKVIVVPVRFVRNAVIHVEVDLLAVDDAVDVALQALQAIVDADKSAAANLPANSDLLDLIHRQDDGRIEIDAQSAEESDEHFIDFYVTADPGGLRFR